MAKSHKERLLSSISVNENGCWIWQKSKSQNGYGSFALGGGSNARAHRISYQCFIGEIPENFDVCHKCDVRDCVNPSHLFVGTRSENILDASKKGRLSRNHQLKGSDHPSSKLTELDVRSIIKNLRDGQSKKSLSRQFGVSQRVILLIARNESWKHVNREAA